MNSHLILVKSTNISSDNAMSIDQEENETIAVLKKNTDEIFQIGFGLFLGLIQIILKTGKNDIDKVHFNFTKNKKMSKNNDDNKNEDN